MKDMPAYVKIPEFAKACGFARTINARRLLRKSGLIEHHPGVGQVVDPNKVREKFFNYYQKLYEHFVGTEET